MQWHLHRVALRPPIPNGIWKCWFLWREENRIACVAAGPHVVETRNRRYSLYRRCGVSATQAKNRRNPLSKDENQQQTQPTYDTGTRNRTRATLVRGECSHHCAIPAPLNLVADPGFLKGGGDGLTWQNDIGTIGDKVASVIVLLPFLIPSLNDAEEGGG